MATPLADGIGPSETSQTRGAQPEPLVGGSVSKTQPRFPISASVYDLLFRSRNEVPPHEDLFGKWRPADEQYAASFAAGQKYVRAPAAQVVKDPLLQRLIIEPGVSLQDQQRMFEGRLNRSVIACPRCTCTSAPRISEK